MKYYEHKVQYYETDQMQVVHHSNYIRWFEECRTELMDRAGMGYKKMEQEGIICPVVSVSCRYITMTRFGDTVEISAQIKKFNGIRLNLIYEVRDKETGELRCRGESCHCFLNDKGKPVNLAVASPAFYDMFQKLKEDYPLKE